MKATAKKKPLSPVVVIIYIVLALLVVIYVAPLLWMLCVSLKDNAGVMADPFGLPKVLHPENYAQAWSMGKLGAALVNSALVCGVSLVVSLFFGSMAAFAIARMKWKLSEAAHTFFLIGDGTGTLYSDPIVRTICPSGTDQQPVWSDDTIYHFFPADDDFPDDRIL